jgi:hypothetical protein
MFSLSFFAVEATLKRNELKLSFRKKLKFSILRLIFGFESSTAHKFGFKTDQWILRRKIAEEIFVVKK